MAYGIKDSNNGNYTSELVGVYKVTGSGDNAIKKLTLTGMSTAYRLDSIGNGHSGCYGMVFSAIGNGRNHDVGVLCTSSETQAIYSSLKQLKSDSETDYPRISIIN